jgi:hypothetical protein
VPRLVFHPDVSVEIRASYSWYQELAEGLGDDFLDELESAYEAILEFHQTWPFFQKGFRRFLLSRFPFSVIYRMNGDTIYIVAVMHHSRKPGHWHART